MIELSLIKYFLKQENYVKYCSYINVKDIQQELQIVFTSLAKFYATHTEDLSVQDLANLVFSLSPKDKEYYQTFFENLDKYEPIESTVIDLINSIKKKKVLQDLSIAAYEVSEGKKEYEVFTNLLSKLEDKPVEETFEFVTDDLEVLIDDNIKTPGLRWRLGCLNQSLGSLRRGDFGFIFARPETGKTTFLASEVSYFLSQTEGNILWIN